MAYRLNLADNRLPIFDQSRLPITDILSVLSFTDTDNRYSLLETNYCVASVGDVMQVYIQKKIHQVQISQPCEI